MSVALFCSTAVMNGQNTNQGELNLPVNTYHGYQGQQNDYHGNFSGYPAQQPPPVYYTGNYYPGQAVYYSQSAYNELPQYGYHDGYQDYQDPHVVDYSGNRGSHQPRGGRGRGQATRSYYRGRGHSYYSDRGPGNNEEKFDQDVYVDEERKYQSKNKSFSHKTAQNRDRQQRRYKNDDPSRGGYVQHSQPQGYDTYSTGANSNDGVVSNTEQSSSQPHNVKNQSARNQYKKSGANNTANRGQKSWGQGHGKQFKSFTLGPQEDVETQRDSLIEQLSNNSYECMVCCDTIRRDDAVWSCTNCYHIYHLRCIKRWAKSSTAALEGGSTGWRCPACQNSNEYFPYQYRCFCDKMRDPDTSRFEVPHSCGNLCAKERPHGCKHPCNILCHPGPCPPCLASITKQCDCGKTKQSVKCGQASALKCTSTCQKTLNCGQHECQAVCHAGSCDPCEDDITQGCYCGKESRTVRCGTSESFSKSFTCKQMCDRELDCGHHRCDKLCHPGACDTCQLLPSVVKCCPCGQRNIEDINESDQERKICTDPIPTCDGVCGKFLSCGPKDRRHTCTNQCHEGHCEPCPGVSEVTCRCGCITKELSCQEAAKFSDDQPFTCNKRCNKKRQCGKHKCGKMCCTETEHLCEKICGHRLTCGLHQCEEQCHRNNCPTCWRVSFEELHCHCGTEVIYPPVPCGTKAPECRRPCTREHACGHTPRHNCHTDDHCSPCAQLTEQWCLGEHEIRRNIPCHLGAISCGMPCLKDMPCGVHKCQLACHKGPCLTENESCTQPCPRPREVCSHPCGATCHGEGKCPPWSCKTEITLKCECGNKSERALCQLGGEEHEFLRMNTSMLAMTISNTQDGQSVDLSAMMKEANKKKQRKLECSSECAIMERNKRLALALEINNPDVSSTLSNPTYTQFLKDYAKQHTAFVATIEQDLSKLVNTAQQSKQLKRSHAFKPMNSGQRRFIHELAEFYGCETQSYDDEPNKNVVATAYRGKCWLPTMAITKSVQREVHSKAPTPIPHHSTEEDVRSTVHAGKKSASVLGAWGKPHPTAAQAPPPSKPTQWATTTSTGAKGPLYPGSGSQGNTRLKSLSVLRKETEKKEPTVKKEEVSQKPGRKSPVIDYFDMTG